MHRWKVERAYPRVSCDVAVAATLFSDAEGQVRTPLNGWAENVSLEGVMIFLPERVPPGARVTLLFLPPDYAPEAASIETAATIVWSRDTSDGPNRCQHGLRFLRPEPSLPPRLTGHGLPTLPESAHRPPTLSEVEAHRREPGTRSYEVLIKFSRSASAAIEPFLATQFADVNVTETKDPDVLLAYCRFSGEIKALDRKLTELRHSAMVVVGDPRGTFMEFFVSGSGLSAPNRLGPAPGGLFSDVRPWEKWAAGAVVVLGLAGLLVLRGGLPTSGKSPEPTRPPQPGRPAVTVSPWSFYVAPQHHAGWLKVKAKYGLSNELMLALFRAIKQTDAYAPGHSLADLTPYPKAMDRALGLLVLGKVRDADELRGYRARLEALHVRYQPFPDGLSPRAGVSLADVEESFERQVILAFYDQLLAPSRTDLTAALCDTLLGANRRGSGTPEAAPPAS